MTLIVTLGGYAIRCSELLGIARTFQFPSGIRSALGASRAGILCMILSEALRLAVIGAIIGTAGLFFTIRFIDKMLYAVTSFDWPTLVGMGVTLAVVMLLASFWPARRAASVDPLVLLRAARYGGHHPEGELAGLPSVARAKHERRLVDLTGIEPVTS
jgi:predicted lysophospholipase L1 biosynthesis ABC-type transport system permease subunit